MPTPKYVERVATLEAEWRVFRTETFPAFQNELKSDLNVLGEKIDAASMNGQTPRAKLIAKELGDPEDVMTLKGIVEGRKRNAWLFSPLNRASGQFLSALVWGGGALVLAWANAQIHAAIPSIP